MKVCLVSYEYPPTGGGEGSYTAALARGIAQAGSEVFLVLPESGADYELPPGNVTLRTVKTSRRPFGVASFIRGVNALLPRMIQEHRIDLVHVTFDYTTYPLKVGSFKRPLVATVHHFHTSEHESLRAVEGRRKAGAAGRLRSSVLTYFERNLLKGASAIIAISQFTASEVVRELGTPLEKVHIVYHGIDMRPFGKTGDPSGFREAAKIGSEKVVLFVGRLEKSKGVHYLLEAFKDAKPKVKDACLVVVGSGSPTYQAQLKAATARLSIQDSVRFMGRVDFATLLDAYAAADVVVLPSLMEGLGLTLLEAMAAGKPCIASEVGGVPEVVSNRKTGVLFPPGDVDRLASALVELLSDPARARELGSAGPSLVKKSFTAEEMTRKTLAVYEALL